MDIICALSLKCCQAYTRPKPWTRCNAQEMQGPEPMLSNITDDKPLGREREIDNGHANFISSKYNRNKLLSIFFNFTESLKYEIIILVL